MACVPPVVQEACHLAESLFLSPACHSKVLPARAPPGSIGTLQNSCYFFRVNLCPSRVDNVPLTSFGRAREWWDPTYVGLGMIFPLDDVVKAVPWILNFDLFSGQRVIPGTVLSHDPGEPQLQLPGTRYHEDEQPLPLKPLFSTFTPMYNTLPETFNTLLQNRLCVRWLFATIG